MAELILYKSKDYGIEYVVACIIKFCEHEPNQAEQCAMIINSKGEYVIKHGDPNDIEEVAYLFENVGLVTKIVK
jgi:ATP-dependent Clp protease adaptor protein ClpS